MWIYEPYFSLKPFCEFVNPLQFCKLTTQKMNCSISLITSFKLKIALMLLLFHTDEDSSHPVGCPLDRVFIT